MAANEWKHEENFQLIELVSFRVRGVFMFVH